MAVQGFWQVVIERIQGNGKILFTYVPATIDTGTSFIVGDVSMVSDLHTKLGGKGDAHGYNTCEYQFSSDLMFHFHRPPAVPCNKFPTISFIFT
jgi:hypothetical protein